MVRYKVNCSKCKTIGSCCRLGVWVDLVEALIIIKHKIKGEFSLIKQDDDFPSGYCVGTCRDNERCSFLDENGLCEIHKIDYNLKPSYCKQFPMEDSKVSPLANILCQNLERIKK